METYSVKNHYLTLLYEHDENFHHLSSDVVDKIEDADINRSQNYIKLKFITTYGKTYDLITKFTDFMKYAKKHSNKKGHYLMDFLKDFIEKSKEVGNAKNKVDEIVDQNGNIDLTDTEINNSTNSFIGAYNTQDLEKIYKDNIPKAIRFYSGDYGIGYITW